MGKDLIILLNIIIFNIETDKLIPVLIGLRFNSSSGKSKKRNEPKITVCLLCKQVSILKTE
jgi:hypothetical protein